VRLGEATATFGPEWVIDGLADCVLIYFGLRLANPLYPLP
jgi:hypothetical protein